jgi:hypothetical protein
MRDDRKTEHGRGQPEQIAEDEPGDKWCNAGKSAADDASDQGNNTGARGSCGHQQRAGENQESGQVHGAFSAEGKCSVVLS